MTAGTLRLALAVLVGMFLGLGTFTFYYAQGYAYFSNDPVVCANCHIMREHLESWQKSSHHARAACNDCHTPHSLLPKLVSKTDNGWNHSVKFTLQNYAEPIRIRQVNAEKLQQNCLRCHLEFVSEAARPSPHAGTGEADCIRCHAGVGHGPRR